MRHTVALLAFAVVGLAAVGCSGDGDSNIIPPPPPPPPPPGNTEIGLWTTTSLGAGGGNFQQVDRLARPIVNEVLATFANNRHKVNNEINPTQDPGEIGQDIQRFFDEVFSFAPNGRRSQATVDVIRSVLVPDVMKANLAVGGSAAYLGVETNGATGSRFGGRALTDDVIDITLGIVFGTTISDLGLAPPDGKQIPTLTSDNVGPGGKQFLNTFPYLGNPR